MSIFSKFQYKKKAEISLGTRPLLEMFVNQKLSCMFENWE